MNIGVQNDIGKVNGELKFAFVNSPVYINWRCKRVHIMVLYQMSNSIYTKNRASKDKIRKL